MKYWTLSRESALRTRESAFNPQSAPSRSGDSLFCRRDRPMHPQMRAISSNQIYKLKVESNYYLKVRIKVISANTPRSF